MIDWTKDFGAAITVCDTAGNILYMNEKSKKTFEKWGGNLTGNNLQQCHQQKSWDTIQNLINHNEKNVYTIEKNGLKKLIYQAPWYENNAVAGLVEMSLEIPFEMPHFIRS